MRNIEFANFFLLVLFCTIALLGLANFVVRNNFIQSSISVLQIGNKLRRNASATDGLAYKIYTNASALPPSANIVAVRLFKVKPLVIWASEWHMTPTKDLRSLLEPFGVRFIEYNLDPGRCEWHDCAAQKRLKVLNPQNVLDNDENLQNEFYQAYKNDPEMKSVDVVFCGYPVNLCEMFEPFNKSVLVLASTRYDVGRYSKERWDKMNRALIRYSKQPQNVIGGNNLYDAEYIKYYTGINTRHIQSFCEYTSATYTQIRPGYLVLRVRDRNFNGVFFNEFQSACKAINCTVTATLLGHYGSYADVAAHRGIINVPYQISVMSIFEQYRMNIPLFFPTPALLTDWHHKHYIMPERTFDSAFFGNRPHGSVIGPHPSQAQVPDPRNEYDKRGMEYWIKFADFYQIFPHIVYYNSTVHLMNILQTIKSEELWRISKKMEEHNIKTKKELLKEWKEILLNFAKHSRNNPH